MLMEDRRRTTSCGAPKFFDATRPDSMLFEMSKLVRFGGNIGMSPVIWFEDRSSSPTDVISMFAGKLPLIWLLDISKIITFDNFQVLIIRQVYAF